MPILFTFLSHCLSSTCVQQWGPRSICAEGIILVRLEGDCVTQVIAKMTNEPKSRYKSSTSFPGCATCVAASCCPTSYYNLLIEFGHRRNPGLACPPRHTRSSLCTGTNTKEKVVGRLTVSFSSLRIMQFFVLPSVPNSLLLEVLGETTGISWPDASLPLLGDQSDLERDPSRPCRKVSVVSMIDDVGSG